MGLLDRLRGRRDDSDAGGKGPLVPSAPASVTTPATTPVTAPHFAVVDVETTGLSADVHRIIEIAVVTTDPWGRVLDEWSTRLNPEGPVGATHIHGIRDSDVRNAPVFRDIVSTLNEHLAGAAFVAHHARFDLAFLRAEYRRAGWAMPHLPALCTLEASEYHLPGLDRRRLADCCWAVGVPLTGAHSARGDARATAALLAAFMDVHVGYPPLEEHLHMPADALGVRWPTGPTLAVDGRGSSTSTVRRPMSTRALQNMGRTARAGRAPALVGLVERFSLVDALDEGAPAGTVAYLEKLAEALEDGEVTAEEASDLEAVADAEQLSREDIAAAHEAFVLTLAHAALDDGKVSRAERAELQTVSTLLGVNEKAIPALLERAEVARDTRLSAGLKDLPPGWVHGEPLRVGDKVVFTGCEDADRNRLEDRSTQLGVRILNGVSPKVALLVSDGTMDGTKAARARELGTRTVHPDVYLTLLEHLQPALPRDVRALPKTRRVTPRHVARDTTGTVPESVAPSVAASVPESVSGSGSGSPVAAGAPVAVGPDPAVVRAWARGQGLEVGVRGRLSAEIFDAYRAANVGNG